MTRKAAWSLLGLAMLSGTLSDRVEQRAPVYVGGYRMLQADFHIHTFPLSASSLAPWDMAAEARRQGLDVIAVTGHNETASGRLAQWLAHGAGGPRVIAGQEIHGPDYHVIAVGIVHTVNWRLTAAQAIDDVHRQGGIAIAAHPTVPSWKAFEADGAMGRLDGAEVAHPINFLPLPYTPELRQFLMKSGAAAIGSSDFHGMGPLGLCRTYVFATDDSQASILRAIRARRTVVLDRGAVFGDEVLAAAAGPLLKQEHPGRGWLAWLSALSGVAGLIAMAAGMRRG
jgi:hypothetical protein